MHVKRRDFLRKSLCAALGGASLYSALGSLRLVNAAANTSALSDYKALVCIFLYGGNDSLNTIVPYDATFYAQYKALRGGLALTQASLASTHLTPAAVEAGKPGGPPSDGASYALHPQMGAVAGGNAGMADLFNSGAMAVVANVGTLIEPVTKATYNSARLPPQLLSHVDQQNQWQTSRPDDSNANGWGGRIADLLYTANSGQVPMSISLAGSNLFQRGAVVSSYDIDPDGVSAMSYLGDGPESWIIPDDDANASTYDALIAPGTQTHVLERAYADAATRSIANYTIVGSALDGASLTTPFPASDLGAQLQMVAKLIKVRAALGLSSRQVFFCAAGNYDSHTNQLSDQADNLLQLSQALRAFYAATVELGVAGNVTAFTASDFGRTLQANNAGTDHGWGGHHFIVGGAVRGRRFYGTMPSLAANNNPDDTGYGQIIPTLAVDQYVATLAKWFGVSSTGLSTILPNLGRYSAPDLGFMLPP